MLLEREKQSGEVATPCCAHPVTSLGKDTEPRNGNCSAHSKEIQFGELFEVRVMEWQKWLREAGQEILSCCGRFPIVNKGVNSLLED